MLNIANYIIIHELKPFRLFELHQFQLCIILAQMQDLARGFLRGGNNGFIKLTSNVYSCRVSVQETFVPQCQQCTTLFL